MKLRLKNVRIEKGFTQREVADAIGIKLSTYRTWEQGTVKLTLENACVISQAIGCTPNDICGWYEDHAQDEPRAFQQDQFVKELVACYQASTPDRQDRILDTARDAAGMSKEIAERHMPEAKRQTA